MRCTLTAHELDQQAENRRKRRFPVLNPVVILEGIIARLGPEVGEEARRLMSSTWGDFTPEHTAFARSGRGHFATAVHLARAALASGDAEKIQEAALICPTYERTGRTMATQSTAADRRRNGGKIRGQSQAAAAAIQWQPYIVAYCTLLDDGLIERRAFLRIKQKMTADGFVLANGGTFPTDRTIRDRLKK